METAQRASAATLVGDRLADPGGRSLVFAAIRLPPKDDSIPVRTARVERGQIRSLISTNGKIEPVQNFEAHSPLTTTVQRVLVKARRRGQKGQLLGRLSMTPTLARRQRERRPS